jgi:lysophospholipase L1-like esterase
MPVVSGNGPFTITYSDAEPEPCPELPPASAPTLRHRVVDFHFGCAKGIGFISGKDGGLQSFTLAAAATADAASLTFTGAIPGNVQLLVLLGTDGEYYTAAGLSASGSVLTLCDPLPCDIAAGANVWSFWDNNGHPNAKGYAAIADYALRQDFAVWRKVWCGPPSANAPATVTVAPYNSVMNPGSANSGNGWGIAPGGAGGGAKWNAVLASIGDYRLSFECTKSIEGSADVAIEVASDGVPIASYAVNTFTVGRHDVDLTLPGPIDIVASRAATAFYMSNMSILVKEEDGLGSLDHGKHMVLGDSWVYDPSFCLRLSERLPNATILQSGVGGNKCSDLLARFAADVASVPDLDYVWVIVGTNDIAQSIAPDVFARNLYTLINRIQAIGAVPIIFTPYTGCTDIPTRIDMARRYMASVPYYG